MLRSLDEHRLVYLPRVLRTTMAFFTVPKLLDFKNSPPHLQFNRYVLTGYRPASTCTGCLRSLFYLHNESGNIYTHGKDTEDTDSSLDSPMQMYSFFFLFSTPVLNKQLSNHWVCSGMLFVCKCKWHYFGLAVNLGAGNLITVCSLG